MIIEPDQYYYEEGKYVWTPERCAAAWADCYRRVQELVAAGAVRKVIMLIGLPGCGKSRYAESHDAPDVVLFDGLFVDRERRRRLLEMGQAANVPVEAVWFRCPWETCLERNAQRSPDRQVPRATMEQLHRTLEQDPPTLAEGFAALYTVASQD